MKYPILSNWITYRKISGGDAYYVKNHILNIKNIVSSDEMEFARKMDGRTNPLSIRGNRTVLETKILVKELENIGLLRNDGGVVSAGIGHYMRTLVRTKNTRFKIVLSKILNTLLMSTFVPILLVGIYIFLNAELYGCVVPEVIVKIVNDQPALCIWIFNYFSLVCGVAIHELCHGIACRAYGGRVFEYGIMINFLPGFYTLMDETRIKTRLEKIQVLAAGVEGNALFAGCLLFLAGTFPDLQSVFLVGALDNIGLTLINLLAIKGTDGMKILLLLIGINIEDIERIKHMTRERKKELVENDGCYGYAKLTACYIIIWLQRTYPLLILLDVIAIIGVII